jgi:hypothetical protein
MLLAATPNSLHVSFQRSGPFALIRACVAVNLEIVVLTISTWFPHVMVAPPTQVAWSLFIYLRHEEHPV